MRKRQIPKASLWMVPIENTYQTWSRPHKGKMDYQVANNYKKNCTIAWSWRTWRAAQCTSGSAGTRESPLSTTRSSESSGTTSRYTPVWPCCFWSRSTSRFTARAVVSSMHPAGSGPRELLPLGRHHRRRVEPQNIAVLVYLPGPRGRHADAGGDRDRGGPGWPLTNQTGAGGDAILQQACSARRRDRRDWWEEQSHTKCILTNLGTMRRFHKSY